MTLAACAEPVELVRRLFVLSNDAFGQTCGFGAPSWFAAWHEFKNVELSDQNAQHPLCKNGRRDAPLHHSENTSGRLCVSTARQRHGLLALLLRMPHKLIGKFGVELPIRRRHKTGTSNSVLWHRTFRLQSSMFNELFPKLFDNCRMEVLHIGLLKGIRGQLKQLNVAGSVRQLFDAG